MLEFRRKYHDEKDWETIDHDEALNTLLTTFKDNDMTRDMLTVPNWIPCRFATIQVKKDGMVLMPGLSCALPPENRYDDNGNRL